MSDDNKKAIHLDEKSFDSTLEENKDKPILIDFYAEWCGPCQMAAPVMDKLAGEYEGKAVIAKVNVDENQSVAQKYGVMSIPTVVLVKNGEEVAKQVGFIGEDGYKKMIDEHLE